ncbi:MAG: AAA domain-containing protein [Clostridia bacterium]|nr:AAA domain-containing protein [Clostridia bacterium]
MVMGRTKLDVNEYRAGLERVREEIHRVIIGQEEVVSLVLLALLCEGHVLLEGVPGIGKTMLVRALAGSLSLSFSRIQFTPDLMPADILGTSIVMQNSKGGFDLRFEEGPVFANLVLADEINRASPKTQAALLEAMQERTVTIRGENHRLPSPFQVLATQNPLEMEGTYPLPEAQVDRFFFKILVDHPSEAELVEIIQSTSGLEVPACRPVLNREELLALQKAVREVVVPPSVAGYAARLVLATQPGEETTTAGVRKYVRYGAGPRGAQTLVMAAKARALTMGRLNAGVEDVQEVVLPALRHRIGLNFDGLSEGVSIDRLLEEVIEEVPVVKELPPELREKKAARRRKEDEE